jgi:calcineurin-like phosphoesterase family protein
MLWFTSDWHLGHQAIIAYCRRPFLDAIEMGLQLVERFNALVSKTDTTIHVGDVSLDHREVPLVLPLLNGKHWLVPGNHDRCHSSHSKYVGQVERYKRYGFSAIEEQMEVDLPDGPRVLVCHMPYVDDDPRHKNSYERWRPKDEGRWLLHGHCHSPPERRVRGRQIDVGVDAWGYMPISAPQLAAVIRRFECIRESNVSPEECF